jgi:uridine kinase
VPSILIGIAGGSASGKTTVVDRLVEHLGADMVSVIQHDRYYRDLPALPDDERAARNYDHPDALETDLLVSHLTALRAGRAVHAPVYDFAHHRRRPALHRIEPRPAIVVEGILVLADQRLLRVMDLKVFVDTPEAIRFARRLQRDVAERGRDGASVAAQYAATVRPMHHRFVEPSRVHADILIADGGFNEAGVRRLMTRATELIARSTDEL